MPLDGRHRGDRTAAQGDGRRLRMTDPSADYLYRLDRALGRPTITAMVQTEADIEAVAATFGRRLRP